MPQEPITPVVFRKWHNGDIIALMPQEPSDVNGIYCTSYERVGQHGSADDRGVVLLTSPAKPEEYADLKRELESAPYHYKFKVLKRIPRDSYRVRQEKLQKQYAKS